MNIYFAGPLFSESEQTFNEALAWELETSGFTVFLPQRDGAENLGESYARLTHEERREAIFTLDRDQVFDCDIFLFVLDGRVPDEGACVELGMAYTHRRLEGIPRHILGLMTDTRASFMKSRLNPMLKFCFDEIVGSKEELLDLLESLRKKSYN
jgi:nucleoside 2-deoxyribosyltransferase